MSLRTTPFVPGEYYHIYNRGTDKRRIFHDDKDYKRFIEHLYLANSEEPIRANRIKDPYATKRGKQLVSIGAYCLMPNHFHLLVTQGESGNVSKFMHKLLTSYGHYYNIKYHRSGRLFEDKFKSSHIGSDRYLKYIFSYIHLNPVKLVEPKWKEEGIHNRSKILAYITRYAHSSFADYDGRTRDQASILDREAFPDYFPTRKLFQKEILDWINFDSEALSNT